MTSDASDSGNARQEEFLNDALEFFENPGSSSGVSLVPSQPMSFPRPRETIGRDSCLNLHTRNSRSTSGNVFGNLLARHGPYPAQKK